MKKYSLLCILLFSISVNAQVTKVEHFFAGSPKAEAIFNFFKNELGLPVVWDFLAWGGFSSGGVSLGNVAFELATYDGVTKTQFEGIALEPRQSVEEFILQLDRAQVSHDTIEPHTFVMSNGKIAGWSNLGLRNLLPDTVGFFICDYKSRERVFLNRKEASDSLANRHGGPLGVVLLKEIVVGCKNVSMHATELAKLPGIKKRSDTLFGFQEGPSLRLQTSSMEGIEKIVIKVHSLAMAKQYLKSHNLLGTSSGHGVVLDSKAIDGLLVELVEK